MYSGLLFFMSFENLNRNKGITKVHGKNSHWMTKNKSGF